MTHFDEYGYEVVKNAISAETAEVVARSVQMARDVEYFNERLDTEYIGHRNDNMINQCFSIYSLYPCEVLLDMLKPTMERITGKYLYPAYSYTRIYYTGAELKRHRDRPSCEYSATMTLSRDDVPWDIWIEDFKGNNTPISLDIGSMCVYQGTKVWHWREPFKGKQQIQVFLHYVDERGRYFAEMYDGRAMLGAPQLKECPYREPS